MKKVRFEKVGSGELFNMNYNHSFKLEQNTEYFFDLDGCTNANYNNESLHSHIVSHPNSNKNTQKF